jgi:hypothetical protein
MNKFIKITIGSTVFGLMAVTIAFWYSYFVKPADLKPIWQSTTPPPLSLSPVWLLLVGFLLLAFLRLRRKNP